MHNSIIISLSNHIWPNRISLNALLNIATISLMELWVIAINIAVAVGRLLASVVRFVSRKSLFHRMRFQILKFYVIHCVVVTTQTKNHFDQHSPSPDVCLISSFSIWSSHYFYLSQVMDLILLSNLKSKHCFEFACQAVAESRPDI